MKNKIIYAAIIFVMWNLSHAQVGIGTATPDASSILDISSTTKGFLPPRMDEVARDTINGGAPPEALLIYNIDTDKLNFYNGSSWQAVVDNSNQTIDGDKTFNGTIIAGGRLMIPMGEISYYEYSPGYTVTISAASSGASGNDNMVKINPAGGGETVNFINDMFTAAVGEISTVNDTRLKYTGATTRYFHIALSFSYKAPSNNQSYVFGVAKGGEGVAATVQNSSKLFTAAKIAGESQSTAMHVLLKLKKDDYIEFWVGNLIGSTNITIQSMNFVAIGM